MKILLPFLSLCFGSVFVDGRRLTEAEALDAKVCNADIDPIDFLVIEGDANFEAIGDEIRTDLEKIGLKMKTRILNKNDVNQARAKGDFGLSTSETWGSPYDPHSYVSAWEAEDNANYHALANLTAPASREELLEMIEDVLAEDDSGIRVTKWQKVHEYYHQQAVMLPVWGRRIVAIINTKLDGYQRGHQLQELSFIRPLRFLSPNAFAEGSSSDPFTANSCERGWRTLTAEDGTTVVCKGIANVSGTGPFALSSRKQSVLTTGDFDETRVDDEVIFKRNENYWDGVSAFETLKVGRYESADDIKAALLDGSLDVMWGGSVLPANDVTEIDDRDDPNLNVFYGDDIQNTVLLLNTGTPPLDDINVRKAVIHAINKKAIIDKELGGYLDPVDHIFPESMPYCDVSLTPHWDYDSEKAILLSCADESANSGSNNTLALGLGLGSGLAILAAVGIAVFYHNKSKHYEVELQRALKGVDA